MRCVIAAALAVAAAERTDVGSMAVYPSTDCTGQAMDDSSYAAASQCIPTGPTSVAVYCDEDTWHFEYHLSSDCTDTITLACSDVVTFNASNPTQLPNLAVCSTSAASGACAAVFDFSYEVGGVTVAGQGLSMTGTCGSTEKPCFSASESFACRLTDGSVPPATALEHCFGHGASSSSSSYPPAERVAMGLLVAGDVVLPSPTAATRVLVNQHAAVSTRALMVEITHSTGSLALTPDHVLYVDGAWRPAREVRVGSVLEPGAASVTKVRRAPHKIISPVTLDGKILASGPAGQPVLATVWPEWVATLLLDNPLPYPLPLSLAAATSRLFPAGAQRFYDAHLEHFFAATSPGLEHLTAAVPAPVALAVVAAADVACVGAFATWALCSLEGAAALLGVAAVARSRRVARA